MIRYPLIRVARPDLGNVVVEDAAMPQLESSAPAHGKVEGESILQAQLILDKAMNSAISRGEVDKLLQVALKDKMVAASVPGSEVETFMKLVNGGPPSKDHASDQHMKRSEENYTFGNPFEIGVVVTLGGCAVAVIFLFVGRKKTRSRSRSSRRKSATSHLEDKVFSSDDFSFASESSASNMNDDVDMRTISTFTGISRSNETSSRMLGVFAPTDFSFATPEPSTLLTQPPSLHLSTALAPPTVLKSTPASNNNFVLPPTDPAAPFNEIEFGASSTEDASLSTDLSSRASVTSRLMKSRMSTPDKSVISSAERSNLSTPDKSRLSTPDSLSFASAGGGGSPTGTLVESANSLLDRWKKNRSSSFSSTSLSEAARSQNQELHVRPVQNRSPRKFPLENFVLVREQGGPLSVVSFESNTLSSEDRPSGEFSLWNSNRNPLPVVEEVGATEVGKNTKNDATEENKKTKKDATEELVIPSRDSLQSITKFAEKINNGLWIDFKGNRNGVWTAPAAVSSSSLSEQVAVQDIKNDSQRKREESVEILWDDL